MAATLALGGAAVAQTPPIPTNGNMEAEASRSAQADAPTTQAEKEFRNRLGTDGYSDVRDVKREADGWSGSAVHKGKRHAVRVGPDGKIVKTPMT